MKTREIHESFQLLLEALSHSGYCDGPYSFQQRPYGVIAVSLARESANPVQLGALLIEESESSGVYMYRDDLMDLLEKTMVTMDDESMVLYWPDVKYDHDL